MKHLILFEEYKDFVGKGDFNQVSELDKDWLIKTPLPTGQGNLIDKTNSARLGKFKREIKLMKDYPEFFVEVKKLDRYRAAVRRVDVKAAQNELRYLYNVLGGKGSGFIPKSVFLTLYNAVDGQWDGDELKKLGEYGKTNNDKIVLKWFNFITALRSKFAPIELDLHWGNVGLMPNGDIKIIDP